MAPEARAVMTSHMASCPSCRRYDRVVRKGVAVLRSAPEPKPRHRLGVVTVRRRARLAERRENRRREARGSSTIVGAVAFAAVLAGVASLPMLFDAVPETETATRESVTTGAPGYYRPGVGFPPVLPSAVAAQPSFPWGAAISSPVSYSSLGGSFAVPAPSFFPGPSFVHSAYADGAYLDPGFADPGFRSLQDTPEEIARAMLVEYGRNRARMARDAAAPDL